MFHADRGRRVGAESRLCQKVAVQAQGQSESFSALFSTGDNFSLAAGKQAHIGGADRFTKTCSNGETLYYNQQQILLLLKRQMEFLRQCLSRTLLIMDTNRTWTSLMHNNEFYVCRVCGTEQLDPPWGKMVKYQVMTYVTVVVLSLGMKI
ncbi:hypothetical protein ACP3P6_05145 [Enterobacter mori]